MNGKKSRNVVLGGGMKPIIPNTEKDATILTDGKHSIRIVPDYTKKGFLLRKKKAFA